MNSTPSIASADPPDTAPYKILASRMGVEFQSSVRSDRLVLQDAEALMLLRRPDPVAVAYLSQVYGRATFLVGPSRGGLERLPWLRAQSALVRSRFRVIPHNELRKAIIARVSASLSRHAVHGLSTAMPQYSALTVATTAQAMVMTALFTAFCFLAYAYPAVAIDTLRVVATLAFFSCTLLRCIAAARSPLRPRRLSQGFDEELLPTYTVLVPLHDEAALVPQLLTALGRIAWPRHKLEIKLICEADDAATLAAIRAHQLRDYVEVIEVPPSLPRTKPKALRYALQASRGELVVLYDAEDIPHPLQLREAWQMFARSGPELACLQAPLDITNRNASALAGLFAFEYVGLFRCLLPWLARRGAVLPLGGTSNHFRRAALEDVGAWDPHNVTEDADLGVRLARFGYRSDVLSMPTCEEAPETADVWFPQRARWSKGWMQTWLVHMRNPSLLLAELGPRNFLLTQILLGGIVASSLLHPMMYGLAGWFVWSLARGVSLTSWQVTLFCADIFNIACGYAGFIAVGRKGEGILRRRSSWRLLAWTPAYWLMISAATWIALFELFWRPFHWHKTPHKPVRQLRRSSALF